MLSWSVYFTFVQYRTHVDNIDSYLRRNHVRPSLRRLVRQHFKQSYETSGMNDELLLQQMPRTLRREIMIEINMRTIRLAPVFLGTDKAMVALVCSLLSRAFFLKGELLTKQGDVMRELLVLEHGNIQQIIEPPADQRGDGDNLSDAAGDEGDEGSKTDSKVAMSVDSTNHCASAISA